MMDLKPLSHSVHPRAGSQSACKALKAASISPVAQGSGDGSNQQSSTGPIWVYPLSTWHYTPDQISQVFPSTSPCCKRSKTGGDEGLGM